MFFNTKFLDNTGDIFVIDTANGFANRFDGSSDRYVINFIFWTFVDQIVQGIADFVIFSALF